MNTNNLIQKATLIPIIVMLGALPFQMAFANGGVDDLRGRWDIVIGEPSLEGIIFVVYVNDSQAVQDGLLAAGCMKSPDSGVLAPLSMQAQPVEGGYNVKFASTAIPQAGEPVIVQFTGLVETFGKGVPDDSAEGTVTWGTSGKGTWEGTHHDRRRTDCPPVEIPPFRFGVDVWMQEDIYPNQDPYRSTALEGFTNIVSTGMLVQKPDGSAIVVPPFTDIFSPNVDFITSFRYLAGSVGEPISGQQYTMTLLDALGNPIPGATKTDVWTGCFITPPRNLRAQQQNLDINLAWDSVPQALGFDPANGIGFYQIVLNPASSWEGLYGAYGIKSTYHVIPWNDFSPPAPALPDGFDVGEGLNRLSDGNYRTSVKSFSEPPPNSLGVGHECEIVDFGEDLYFEKAGNSIIF